MVTFTEHNFYRLCVGNPASGLLQIGQKSGNSQWHHNFRHDGIVHFFWRCFVSLVKFSYWSKFYVNVITGSGIMTIVFYKGLTRNREIGNTLVWVLPNTWRLGRVMDTKIGTILSNRILLNAAKIQGYSFYRFWVTKGKPTVGAGKTTPPPPLYPELKAMLNSIDLYKGILFHAFLFVL